MWAKPRQASHRAAHEPGGSSAIAAALRHCRGSGTRVHFQATAYTASEAPAQADTHSIPVPSIQADRAPWLETTPVSQG